MRFKQGTVIGFVIILFCSSNSNDHHSHELFEPLRNRAHFAPIDPPTEDETESCKVSANRDKCNKCISPYISPLQNFTALKVARNYQQNF